MQPYFFPYLGYFSLIAASDHFVVFDPVQYIRHGWINRNRILKPGFEQVQYVTVPLSKHSRDTKIRDIMIAAGNPWRERMLGQVQHYKKRAPNFGAVISLLRECFDVETHSIVDLNVHCLDVICRYLEIDFCYSYFGEIESQVASVEDAGDWALNSALAMQATTYLNPIGGRQLFNQQKFVDAGVDLGFIEMANSGYSQPNDRFQTGLSIIDVLMFNDIEQTNSLINDYSLTQN